MSTVFDLTLFKELNEEYASKPIVARAHKLDAAAHAERADRRTDRMVQQLKLEPGQRVLEIGCGRGHLAHTMAVETGVEVVGVDIARYDDWEQTNAVSLLEIDVVDLDESFDNTFDAAYSLSVWEHVQHPAAALEAMYRVLKPGGVAFVQAQLYPGPKASHRYREVFFPWPHLLFTPDVFEEFYVDAGLPPRRPAWLNRWTELHYRFHVDRIGFERRWWSTPHPLFDDEFYRRFHDELSQYPKWDLSHDALITRLRKPKDRAD